MEKRLSDSRLFREMIYNEKLKNVINDINPSIDKVDLKYLSDPLNVINKKINFSTKSRMFELLNNGTIIIMNTTGKPSLPRYLNAIGKKSGDRIVYFSEICNYVKHVDKERNIEIFPKTLFGLIQNAVISFELANNWKKIANNTNVMIQGSISYALIVGKVLDKQFAININPVRRDLIHFHLAKFFLIGLCGYEESDEIINSIALKSTINNTRMDAILQLTEMNKDLTKDCYSDIITLFTALKNFEGLSNLKIRSFIEQYVRFYGETTLLSVDYLPSFLSMIFNVELGSDLCNNYILDSVASKSNSKLVNEIGKIAF